jgi:Ca2+/Na+ antiporter
MTRALIVLLAFVEGVIGVWATVAPLSFYEDGPIPFAGTGWVAALPPYNEHLMRDYGTMTLALTVVLAYAAVKMTPSIVRLSMVASLVFAVPHTVFHMLHLEHFSPADAVGQSVTLVFTIVLPLVVLALGGKRVKAAV